MASSSVAETLRVLVVAPHPDDETIGTGATMAKYAAAHAALDAADWAIQVYGGAGYVVDSGIERHCCDGCGVGVANWIAGVLWRV